MSGRRLGRAAIAALHLSISCAAAQSGPRLPDDTGKAVAERMCAPCHGLSVVVSTRRSREDWQNVVANMVSRGAVGSPEDVKAVVDYLSAHFGSTETKSTEASRAMAKRTFTISPSALNQQIP